jgi:hypothetical protein
MAKGLSPKRVAAALPTEPLASTERLPPGPGIGSKSRHSTAPTEGHHGPIRQQPAQQTDNVVARKAAAKAHEQGVPTVPRLGSTPPDQATTMAAPRPDPRRAGRQSQPPASAAASGPHITARTTTTGPPPSPTQTSHLAPGPRPGAGDVADRWDMTRSVAPGEAEPMGVDTSRTGFAGPPGRGLDEGLASHQPERHRPADRGFQPRPAGRQNVRSGDATEGRPWLTGYGDRGAVPRTRSPYPTTDTPYEYNPPASRPGPYGRTPVPAESEAADVLSRTSRFGAPPTVESQQYPSTDNPTADYLKARVADDSPAYRTSMRQPTGHPNAEPRRDPGPQPGGARLQGIIEPNPIRPRYEQP